MAVTIQRYNHTLTLKNTKAIDYDSIKVMLLSNAATFSGSDATLDDVAGALSGDPLERENEVYGNNWEQGGAELENAAFTTVAADVDTVANDSKFDADDVSRTATGGAIGPAYKAVIYDDAHADKAPLFFIDFGEAQTAGQDTDFKFVWHSSGIYLERNFPT